MQQTESQDIGFHFDRLIAAMRVKDAPALWEIDDICSWLKLSKTTVRVRVVTRKGFPDPVEATAIGEKCMKRWFSDEVIEWARKNRGRLPDKSNQASPPSPKR